jgi:signal transduction histidine kinase
MESIRVDTQAERDALADLLNAHRHEIERRWMARVKTMLGRHQLPEPELRDSVPDYIEALVRALRVVDDRALEERGGGEWDQIARQHAITRVRLGFDVDEVLREFNILRQEILAVLGERTTLTQGQIERIVDLISGAVSASVKSYVESRDYQSRREQAEHVGFLTHELRNPLTTATAAAGQIRRWASALPEVTRPIELLEKNLKRLRELIDKALLTQRFEAQAVEVAFESVRLGDLVEEGIRAAQATASGKGVELEVSHDPEILLYVDRLLAVSAIQNLVDNAAKFTDRGKIELTVEDRPDEVVVHVRDGCDGLSPEELRTIFEPFKRGHRGKSGTGLGLAIARHAVEAHGKRIQAESVGSFGCHFWFALPKARH